MMAEIKTVLTNDHIIDDAWNHNMEDHHGEIPDKVIEFARAIEAAVLSANAGKVDESARLDFVIENETSWYPGYYHGAWQSDKNRGTLCYGKNRMEAEGTTMRDAIDAAMKSIAQQAIDAGKVC